MTSTPARLITAEELFELPDDGCRYELVRGALREMPPCSPRSSEIGTLISAALVARMLGSESDANVFDEAARQARQLLLEPRELNEAESEFRLQNFLSSAELKQRW